MKSWNSADQPPDFDSFGGGLLQKGEKKKTNQNKMKQSPITKHLQHFNTTQLK